MTVEYLQDCPTYQVKKKTILATVMERISVPLKDLCYTAIFIQETQVPSLSTDSAPLSVYMISDSARLSIE